MATSLVGTGAAQAADDGIRNLTRAETREFLTAAGLRGPARCYLVGLSRSNERWALVSPTQACGPNSGHSTVYRQRADGTWRYLFYDMQVDGCEEFGMPAAVRADFTPYVC